MKRVHNQLKKYKKRGLWLGEKHILKEIDLYRVLPSCSGYWSTQRVDWVLSSFCLIQSFILPGSVQPPGPWSTRQAGPDLRTMI